MRLPRGALLRLAAQVERDATARAEWAECYADGLIGETDKAEYRELARLWRAAASAVRCASRRVVRAAR